MTEKEALDTSYSELAELCMHNSEFNYPSRQDFESGWDAALEWARSQQKPYLSLSYCTSRGWHESDEEDEDDEVVHLFKHPAPAPDVSELVEALRKICHWLESQAKAQSKGGHSTFDLMMLREHRDIAEQALAKWGRRNG